MDLSVSRVSRGREVTGQEVIFFYCFFSYATLVDCFLSIIPWIWRGFDPVHRDHETYWILATFIGVTRSNSYLKYINWLSFCNIFRYTLSFRKFHNFLDYIFCIKNPTPPSIIEITYQIPLLTVTFMAGKLRDRK